MIIPTVFSSQQATISRDFHDAAKNFKALSSEGVRQLQSDFVPGPLDVICSRSRTARNHTGNKRYERIIKMNVKKYEDSESRIGKSLIISSIIDSIRDSSPTGGFIKHEEGVWYEIGDHAAREKVSNSFRNALHTKYRSSNKSKKVRREALKVFDCGYSATRSTNRSVDNDNKEALDIEIFSIMEKDILSTTPVENRQMLAPLHNATNSEEKKRRNDVEGTNYRSYAASCDEIESPSVFHQRHNENQEVLDIELFNAIEKDILSSLTSTQSSTYLDNVTSSEENPGINDIEGIDYESDTSSFSEIVSPLEIQGIQTEWQA